MCGGLVDFLSGVFLSVPFFPFFSFSSALAHGFSWVCIVNSGY